MPRFKVPRLGFDDRRAETLGLGQLPSLIKGDGLQEFAAGGEHAWCLTALVQFDAASYRSAASIQLASAILSAFAVSARCFDKASPLPVFFANSSGAASAESIRSSSPWREATLRSQPSISSFSGFSCRRRSAASRRWSAFDSGRASRERVSAASPPPMRTRRL